MLGRVKQGLMETFSCDAGKTWSAPVWARVQSVSSRFHLRRLASGRILLIKHGRPAAIAASRRDMLCAFLSEDDGETWTDGLILDARHEVSYPDSAQDEHGRLYITYDRDRATRGEVLLARLYETDILNGEIRSADALMQHVVCVPGRAGKG